MRYVFSLIFCLTSVFAPIIASAQNWEDQHVFNGAQGRETLRVLSSTDTSFFAPIIEQYLREQPNLNVEYLVTATADLDGIFRRAPDQFDVVISSAMDLQLKLANDGFALRVDGVNVPEWAQWRKSLFAFTTEPAAIVINRAAFDGHRLPSSRQELIKALRARPDTFRGKLGTYDVRQSGLGYLFATQDARTSETYWRLMEVMGGLGTRLYCCSGAMIDDLVSGKIVVAYNVLGSYATARADVVDKIKIILPSDFPTTMMRTALVSNQAPQQQAAIAFLRHLISGQKRGDLQGVFPLPVQPIDPQGTHQSIIALEPALMTYLDRLKRRKFLRAWEDAIIQ